MALRGYIPKYKKAIYMEHFPAKQKFREEQVKEQRTGIYRRIRPVHKGRQRVTAEYRREAKAAVETAIARGDTCPVFAVFDQLPIEMQLMLTQNWNGERRRRSNKINEVHHSHGRCKKLLMYKPWWILMSKWGHRAVHAFPDVARAFGWICAKGQWNNQPPE